MQAQKAQMQEQIDELKKSHQDLLGIEFFDPDTEEESAEKQQHHTTDQQPEQQAGPNNAH